MRQKERKEVEHIKSKNRTHDDRVLVTVLLHWESVVRRGWSPVTLTQTPSVRQQRQTVSTDCHAVMSIALATE